MTNLCSEVAGSDVKLCASGKRTATKPELNGSKVKKRETISFLELETSKHMKDCEDDESRLTQVREC